MQRGDPMAPGALSAVGRLEPDLGLRPDTPEADRRLALAHWIADSRNPLTARVIVNRIWQGHFGRGIVGTPSDFGRNGERPTHPELLDWLANYFTTPSGCGWRMKQLHRMIVTSYTYCQSSASNPA